MIFKIEDKVFDYAYGWGYVYDISDEEWGVYVTFEGEQVRYNKFGRVNGCSFDNTLSFTEYTLEGFSQVRPKEPLPFDRWYVSDTSPDYIAFEGSNYRYGISISGYWFNKYERTSNRIVIDNHRLATDEQILEKLSAYANSIGIMAGATFVALGRDFRIKIEDKPSIGFTYNTEYNSLLFDGWLIMRDGKWVAVVEETKTLAEEIQAIKKHLGI